MPKFGDGGDLLKCSFCGKSQKQVKKLIAGPGVYICDECIDLCNEIIEEELAETSEFSFDELPKPSEIYEFLNSYVVGQDQAKKTLAVAVYNHYKRVQAGTDGKPRNAEANVELAKSNILLLGPTGSGKTLLAQTLARMLNVPFAIADATALTEAGYVGEDVENILLKLIQAADFDIKKAETGIIYIDEVDKIVGKRIGKSAVGFGAEVRSKSSIESSELLAKVMPEDLLNFGLIPEFIGRLPVISAVHQLKREDLVQILMEPKNALVKQYQRFFGYDNIELVFTDDALWEIADKALERETGARGLRSIIETALLDVMFELPSRRDVSKCVITKETIEKHLKPTLVTSAEGVADDEAAPIEESA